MTSDKTPVLPVAEDCKDEIYSAIINDLYKEYVNSLSKIEEDVKENGELLPLGSMKLKHQ